MPLSKRASMCGRALGVYHGCRAFRAGLGVRRDVFPALNQKLLDSGRRVRAVPFDLRWGLTAEDTSDEGLG